LLKNRSTRFRARYRYGLKQISVARGRAERARQTGLCTAALSQDEIPGTGARFAKGTFKRIKAVLKDREERTDFVREAVDRELKRREGLGARKAFAKVT
jgi:hypothetical protein